MLHDRSETGQKGRDTNIFALCGIKYVNFPPPHFPQQNWAYGQLDVKFRLWKDMHSVSMSIRC